jgi:outer membrane immunogenic protein
MKRVFLAGVGMLALLGQAAAADLGRRAPAPYPVKAPMMQAAYNWTGFYIGVNGGGGWGRSSWDATSASTGGFDVSGGLVGGTVGYNYQYQQVVWGVEGDIDWSNIRGTSFTNCPAGCETKNTWLSTARGRLGFAADRWMPYITGGAAFGNIQANIPGFAGASSTKTGWTLGGGVEVALAGNWTAKAEYLYVDLGSFDCGLNCGAVPPVNVNFRTNIVRGGINYRF